jgi:hypothetical protein
MNLIGGTIIECDENEIVVSLNGKLYTITTEESINREGEVNGSYMTVGIKVKRGKIK